MGELTKHHQTGEQPVTKNERVELERTVREKELQILTAKRFPRNVEACRERINQACTRPAFAEKALYSYPRGGEVIMGPSIRLAELLASEWGNLDAGVREMTTEDGRTEVEAYVIDYETNARFSRTFWVDHWRDTRSGGHSLNSKRDIYEHVMNMAQRRLRAVIFQALPNWLIDEAVATSKKTLAALEEGKEVADIVASIVQKFGEFGVGEEQLVDWAGGPLQSLTVQDIVELRVIAMSISVGEARASEFFNVKDQTARTQALQQRVQKRRKKLAAQTAPPPEEPEESQEQAAPAAETDDFVGSLTDIPGEAGEEE